MAVKYVSVDKAEPDGEDGAPGRHDPVDDAHVAAEVVPEDCLQFGNDSSDYTETIKWPIFWIIFPTLRLSFIHFYHLCVH